MEFVIAFFIAGFATCGFTILFHVPARDIVPASVVGALGWLVYKICVSQDLSPVWATFLAACVVYVLSDISARVFKDASTIFTIPGIIPLVPGAGIFYTLRAFIQSNMADAGYFGRQTLFIAGAIALGLLIAGAVFNLIVAFWSKVKKLPMPFAHRR